MTKIRNPLFRYLLGQAAVLQHAFAGAQHLRLVDRRAILSSQEIASESKKISVFLYSHTCVATRVFNGMFLQTCFWNVPLAGIILGELGSNTGCKRDYISWVMRITP